MSTLTQAASAAGGGDAESENPRGAWRTDQLRGSYDGISTMWTRSVVIVGCPEARHRSHAADVSREVGHRMHRQTSAAARYRATSSSGTKPTTVTRSATPNARASASGS